MSDIERFITIWAGGMIPANNDYYVRYDDHRAEVERLIAERDEARADVEQLTQNLVAWKKDYQELEQERNRAWDLGEELNRELEGQKAANQRLLRECAEDIASAKAREEAATTELNETREKLARVQVEVEQLKNAICYLTSERDEAQDERDAAQAEVGRLRANGQAILDSSRPSDEDIWRHAFTATLQSPHFNRTKMADEVLAEYRKRWPR